jgi:hypothetical protein
VAEFANAHGQSRQHLARRAEGGVKHSGTARHKHNFSGDAHRNRRAEIDQMLGRRPFKLSVSEHSVDWRKRILRSAANSHMVLAGFRRATKCWPVQWARHLTGQAVG